MLAMQPAGWPARLAHASTKHRATIGAFVVAFAAIWLVGWLQGEKPFVYDSLLYWTLTDSFVGADGQRSLWNFDNELRGYVPALLFGGLRELGANPAATVLVFNALLLAAIATVLAPAVARIAWPSARFGLVRRWAVAALLLVFWRGYLNYPLADLPALAAVLSMIVMLSRAPRVGPLLLAGVAGGIAVNLRPAYMLIVPAVLIVAWWNSRGAAPTPSRKRSGVAVVAVAVGLVLVFVPQSIVAQRNHGTASPIPGAAANLTQFQLYYGLLLQRYDTYVGTEGRAPQMNYRDPHTAEILAELDPPGQIDGYGAYAQLALEHPITIAGVFLRHVVNGLDQRYSTPYIETVDEGRQRPLRLLGFLVIFAALVRLAWPAARRSLGTPARWRYPVLIGLTCATVLPSAVETRFMLPVALLAYLLVLAPGWPLRSLVPTRGDRRSWIPAATIVAGFVLYAVVVTMIVTGASANLE